MFKYQIHLVYRERTWYMDGVWGSKEKEYYTYNKVEKEDVPTLITKEIKQFGYESWDDLLTNNGTEERDFICLVEVLKVYRWECFEKRVLGDFRESIPAWAQNPSNEEDEELAMEEYEELMSDAWMG